MICRQDDAYFLSVQDGFSAVRFNPYLWPAGEKVGFHTPLKELAPL